jgi:hypothetical protein
MFASFVLAASLGSPPALIAQSRRCNTVVAEQLDAQLNDYEKHPPAPADLDARFTALQDLINAGEGERDILRNVCPEGDFDAAQARIDIAEARAYLQEAQVAQAEYRQSCPAAEVAVTAGFVAAAWYQAVGAMPEKGAPAQPLSDLIKSVQAKATALNLSLPAPADTSHFWLTTVQQKGSAAAKTCPE